MVMQLPRNCKPQDLKDHFKKAGDVRDAKLIADRNSRRSKGIAYVEFREPESVQTALAMNGERLGPAPLIIMMTQSEKNRQAALKEKTLKLGAGPCRVAISNLSFKINSDKLKMLFQPYAEAAGCEIKEAAVIPDSQGRGSSGTGFVEYEVAQAAAMAVEKMNNMMLVDRQIRVSLAAKEDIVNMGGPPNPNMPPQQQMVNGVMIPIGNPMGLNMAGNQPGMPGMMPGMMTGMPPGMMPPGMMPPGFVPPPPAVGGPILPTTQFMLNNMFDASTETDPDWDVDIKDEVLEECSKSGDVVHIYVDKESQGHVYLKFSSIIGAQSAQRVMHGRFFNKQKITVEFWDLASYHGKFPESVTAITPLQPSE